MVPDDRVQFVSGSIILALRYLVQLNKGCTDEKLSYFEHHRNTAIRFFRPNYPLAVMDGEVVDCFDSLNQKLGDFVGDLTRLSVTDYTARSFHEAAVNLLAKLDPLSITELEVGLARELMLRVEREARVITVHSSQTRETLAATEQGSDVVGQDSLGELPDDEPFRDSKPFWDKEKLCLWFQGAPIRTFKRNAKNCFLVLDSFEELGWPSRIDCPIPNPIGDVRADTVASLNSGLAEQDHVKFARDGLGTGYTWGKHKAESKRP